MAGDGPGVWRPGGPLRRLGRELRHRYGREAVKLVLGRMLRWTQLEEPEDGYSIVLGVPWDLRHLLEVNLRFVANCDLRELRELFVVFDRPPKAEAEEQIAQMRERFAGLPLTFLFHEPRPGRIVERVNISTFYNSMNTVTALSRCTTRYAILHDFDLYPLVPEYFQAVVDAMRQKDLRFSGLELTPFEGLSEDDGLIGTWCLGIDVPWLRANWRPIHCFHRMGTIRGRRVNLDPYSWIQSRTPQRALAGAVDGSSCCHAKNLCSTYLRFRSRRAFEVAWRLHYLWYLESLCGRPERLDEVVGAMDAADSSALAIDGRPVEFGHTHASCADVLRQELERMEAALFGEMRPEVERYLQAFAEFLDRHGRVSELQEQAA